MKKYLDTFLLFGSLGLIVIWVDQFIYKDVDFKDCYFFLMFSIAGFLIYLYRRGLKKMEEDKNKPSKPKIKPTINQKSKKK